MRMLSQTIYSGFGSVGRAVASDNKRSPVQIQSSSKFTLNICLLSTEIKILKNKEKEATIGPLKEFIHVPR